MVVSALQEAGMRQRLGRVALVLALGVGAAGSATAQAAKGLDAPSRRHGFWFAVGAASGSVGMSCSGCSSDRKSAPSGTVRMGGTLSPHWLLGGEIDGWAKSESGVEMMVASVLVVASWYPSRTGGLFLKFGLGGLAYHEDDPDSTKWDITGGAGIFGLGYDIPVGRTFSITPYLNSIASSNSRITVNGGAVPLVTMNPNLVQFGITLSWF
jgi:hypothetical protein